MIYGTALTLPFGLVVIGLVVFRTLEIIQIQVLQKILKDRKAFRSCLRLHYRFIACGAGRRRSRALVLQIFFWDDASRIHHFF